MKKKIYRHSCLPASITIIIFTCLLYNTIEMYFCNLFLVFLICEFIQTVRCLQNASLYCGKISRRRIVCERFADWSSLNGYFRLHSSLGSDLGLDNQREIILYPSQTQKLADKLDIEPILDFAFRHSNATICSLIILNLDTIDLLFTQAYLSTNSPYVQRVALSVGYSHVTFALNSTLITKQNCNTDLADSITATVFNSLFRFFYFSFHNTFNDQVCPYVFKHARLQSLSINGLVSFFLLDNTFKFVDYARAYELDSVIYRLNIECFNYEVDSSLLDSNVFANLTELTMGQELNSIQTDLFKSFVYLKYIYLRMDCLENFFHKVGMEWTRSLNFYLDNVNMSSVSSQEFSRLAAANQVNLIFRDDRAFGKLIANFKEYTYPDEDFCIFAGFPHQKLVYPYIDSNSSVCTWTILWLIRYYNLYNHSQDVYFDSFNGQSVGYFCLEASMNQTNAWYETKVNNCKLDDQQAQAKEILTTYYDFVNGINGAEVLLNTYLLPAACSLGFILSYKLIRVVSKNRKANLKEDFFKYISLNAKCNCLYSLIYLSGLISYWLAKFVFPITISAFWQYFTFIVNEYACLCVKACANVSYILMSLNRYMLIGKDHSPPLEYISKLPAKRIIRLTVLFSLLFNVGVFFLYKIRDGSIVYFDSTSDDIYLFGNSPFFFENSLGSSTFSLAYTLFYYFVFLIGNTWIEVMIVRRLHVELEKKKLKLATLHMNSTRVNEQKMRADHKKENRAIVMVILNGFINVIMRLPEFFVFISNSNFMFQGNQLYGTLCFTYEMCMELVNYCDLLFILTFTTNYFIYYFFNKKIRSSLNESGKKRVG
jgi:hypothetical protein